MEPSAEELPKRRFYRYGNLRLWSLEIMIRTGRSRKRCYKGCENINTSINDTISGMDASDIYAIDKAMIKS